MRSKKSRGGRRHREKGTVKISRSKGREQQKRRVSSMKHNSMNLRAEPEQKIQFREGRGTTDCSKETILHSLGRAHLNIEESEETVSETEKGGRGGLSIGGPTEKRPREINRNRDARGRWKFVIAKKRTLPTDEQEEYREGGTLRAGEGHRSQLRCIYQKETGFATCEESYAFFTRRDARCCQGDGRVLRAEPSAFSSSGRGGQVAGKGGRERGGSCLYGSSLTRKMTKFVGNAILTFKKEAVQRKRSSFSL